MATNGQSEVIVLGASGGLGSCIAAYLNQAGYRVVGASSREVDLRDETSVETYFKKFAPFGLVNAAGVFGDNPLRKMPLAQWDYVLSVNLRGAFLAIREFLKACHGPGSIVQLGSVVTHRTPYGAGNYTASKAGLLGLIKTAALEGSKRKIRANLISVGYAEAGLFKSLDEALQTRIVEQIPLGLIPAREVAGAAAFCLATEHLTGSEIVLDSGWSI